MKRPLIIIIVLFAGIAAFLGWYRYVSVPNRGFEVGYYGEFNRVANAARAIPGVSITKSWYNRDISLEEFGLTLSVSGNPVELYFGERDRVRSMSREAAVRELKQRIESTLAKAE